MPIQKHWFRIVYVLIALKGEWGRWLKKCRWYHEASKGCLTRHVSDIHYRFRGALILVWLHFKLRDGSYSHGF